MPQSPNELIDIACWGMWVLAGLHFGFWPIRFLLDLCQFTWISRGRHLWDNIKRAVPDNDKFRNHPVYEVVGLFSIGWMIVLFVIAIGWAVIK